MSRHLADHRRTRRSLVTVLAAVLLLVGCAKTDKASFASGPPSTAPTTTTTTAAPTTTTEPPLDLGPIGPENVLGYIATPTGPAEVYAEPDRDSERIDVGETSPAGAPLTFAVVGEPASGDGEWIRVMLPVRPNDRTGFVPADTVAISHTPLRAFVDIDERTMRVERDGEEIARYDIGVGMDHNPTPRFASFVTELLQPPNPHGAYGPYAFGLSIHSDQITEFGDGGDGQVGIHGTNQPDRIGTAVSAGCVRLRNEDIEALVGLEVPLGMPVFIT